MRPLASSSALLLLLGLSTVPSCGTSAPPGFAMRVDWGLSDPTVDIPASVEQLRLLVWQGDATDPDESFHTVANLEDRDGDGNRELCPGSTGNDCTSGGLMPGVVIRITLEGRDGSGRTTHVGHAGPFVLNHGERRHVDMRMYGANAVTALTDPALTPRFLHTATALPDGRVLFAGGFGAPSAATCPTTLPSDAHCFALTARDDAYLLDPTSGRIHAVRGGMMVPRGGHTATVLPDGSVLVAGGAESATLVFTSTPGGYSLDIVPGAGGDTYEIFAPGASPEAEDVDGDGDPGRGGFLGAADDPEVPGRLGEEHVLHAATLLPGGGGRVILAGGRASASRFTIFDLERAGGYGVVGSGDLGTARAAPAAATFGSGTSERAWIIGGAAAASNDDLAEVWRAGTGSDRVGSTAVPMGFPDAVGTDRPGFSLLRPNVEVLGGGTHALVVGWLGARCEDGMTTPTYTPAAPIPCPYSPSENRSFTISASTGAATATNTRNGHALGATARLSDGRVVVVGGFDGLTLTARNTVDLFTGEVSGGVASLSDTRPPMGAARALHTTTALEDGGYVVFGGISPSPDTTSVTAVPGLEVVYLR